MDPSCIPYLAKGSDGRKTIIEVYVPFYGSKEDTIFDMRGEWMQEIDEQIKAEAFGFAV